MKRFNLLIILFLITSLVNGGFNIGMPRAVNKKVDGLDKKVEKKILSDIENAPGGTVTPDDTDGSSNGEWVDADGVGQESINISNLSDIAFPSLCVDSAGNPHIAMRSDSGWIFYLKWNGSAWVDADGSGQESISVSNSDYGIFPSLYLDSAGDPHIAWYKSGLGYYYVKWNGSAWVDADGSGQESIIISTNSAVTPSGLYLSVDRTGNPHIAWLDSSLSEFKIYYLKWNGSAWVDADGSGQESIKISPNKYSLDLSLCLDNSDNPHIVWRAAEKGGTTPDYKIYYLQWNGSAWVDVDGSGQESISVSNTDGMTSIYGQLSLCVDSAGDPHIAWLNGLQVTNFDPYYIKWKGSAWVDADGSGQESINILSTPGYSYAISHCLDSAGDPHIAWWKDNEIYYLKWQE